MAGCTPDALQAGGVGVMSLEKKPTVSVVIPVFNAELYINQTILSVLGQTLPNLELIIVNDGSTDATADVVSSTISAFADGRSTFISRENRGMCASLNQGLALARGKYFAYVGADDIWDPEKLRLQVAELDQTGHAAAFSDCNVIDADGEFISRYGEQFPYRGGNIYYDLIWGKFQPASPTNLFRRDVLESVGRFDESQIWEDRDLWIRIAKDHSVSYIDRPLASYRVHNANGSTTNLDNMYKYALQVLDAAVARDPSLAPDVPRLRAGIDASMAGTFFEKLQMSEARRYAVKALLQRPDSRPAWRALLLSTLGAGTVKRIRERRRS